MEKGFKMIVQFKFAWGLIFTATTLLYSIVSLILGERTIEISLIWKFVAMTLLLTLIHFLVYGEYILKSQSPLNKVIVHFTLCYMVLFVFSYLFDWIQAMNIQSIGIFTISYSLLYLSISSSLFFYYKITGERLNNRLKEYKKRKGRID
ncbi:DUF3021 family protein [Clostridium intestinale]|uniref:DUF3021 family protein n=1 Tax=Clostridium intestinale TaxID=36845 RepID=UPI0028F1695F|nr:DUF3021 family protein [Clostridium intestinale]